MTTPFGTVGSLELFACRDIYPLLAKYRFLAESYLREQRKRPRGCSCGYQNRRFVLRVAKSTVDVPQHVATSRTALPSPIASSFYRGNMQIMPPQPDRSKCIIHIVKPVLQFQWARSIAGAPNPEPRESCNSSLNHSIQFRKLGLARPA